jgi:creatinine amidohydrolase/Fe(II)-dependent formamide hydrolase-like protein
VEKLPDSHRHRVVALSDLSVLLQVAQLAEREFGVPMSEGGLHAGEWETSMLMAIHPDLVHMDRAEPGFVGDPQEALAGLFESGVDALSKTGAIGDPTQASAEHGRRYWETVLDLAMEQVEAESP